MKPHKPCQNPQSHRMKNTPNHILTCKKPTIKYFPYVFCYYFLLLVKVDVDGLISGSMITQDYKRQLSIPALNVHVHL